MANYSGKGGIVKIGTTAVAEVDDWTFDTSVATRNTTSVGQDSVTRAGDGLKDCTGSLSCKFDDTDTNGQQALLEGASVTLKLYPAGDATGRQLITVPAIVSSLSIAAGHNSENVTASISFEGNGDITRSTI